MNQLCDCEKDGFCPRFRREMSGRFRDICRGVDVDLGTAAVFREQWAREAVPVVPGTSALPRAGTVPIPLILKTDQMPGDTLAMTAAVYSLHRAHPGKYATAVESCFPEVFEHNPDASPPVPGAGLVCMHYPAIHRSNERGIHFMQGWCEHLGGALGVSVPLATNRPRLYFADPAPPEEDFWLVCSGGKGDFTAKSWGHDNYQEVVNRLSGGVRFVQVGGSPSDHPPLYARCGENMVGKTTLRQLFDLVRRARGVLCGVSLLMHVAAALEKPAVVVAGGREPVQWNAYAKQIYVHTVGALPCSSVQGHVGHACWRSRTVPLGDGTWYDRDTCERPVDGSPACMRLITPAHVAELVLRYDRGYDEARGNAVGVVALQPHPDGGR